MLRFAAPAAAKEEDAVMFAGAEFVLAMDASNRCCEEEDDDGAFPERAKSLGILL